MNYEQWNSNIKRGRKAGSKPSNSYRTVYRMMRKEGLDVDYKMFSKILRVVAEKIWDKLYAGHIIAVPYLFNMEIVPNGSSFSNRVNWKRTYKLWAEDEDAFEERLLVRHSPSKYIVRVKHSTLARQRKRWFWPLMMEIRLNRNRLRNLEDKYRL